MARPTPQTVPDSRRCEDDDAAAVRRARVTLRVGHWFLLLDCLENVEALLEAVILEQLAAD